MLPPIQAPATACEEAQPVRERRAGRSTAGRTRPRGSPCTRGSRCVLPAARVAACTALRGGDRGADAADRHRRRQQRAQPVVEPSRPPSHQVNPNTTLIRTSACRMAGPAAVRITAKLIDAPSSTSPVLMKNSVRKPPASRSRRPSRVSARLPSRPSRIAYTGNSIAAAIPANAVPLAAAGTVCSRKRVSAARATTTATPASAAWIESRGPGRPWLQQGGLAAMGSSRATLLRSPEPRVSVWSLIRAPASGQQARQHQRQQEQAHDGRGPVFVEGEPAGRRDGRVEGLGDSGRRGRS